MPPRPTPPPPPDPHEVLGAFERLIASLLETRPELRDDVATVAEWVARIARDRGAGVARKTASHAAPAIVESSPEPAPGALPQLVVRPVTAARPATLVHDPRTAQKTAIVPLRIGDAQIHLPVSGSTAEIGHARQSATHADSHSIYLDDNAGALASEPDLSMIARRCALKAASCEVVLRRQRAVAGSAEEAALVAEIDGLIRQAQSLPLCFLWAPYRKMTLPPEDVVFQAGRGYENLALIVALAERIHAEPGLRRHLPDALDLLAESQCALRVILERTWLTRADQDQFDSFVWVSRVTKQEQIFVSRHLRLDDPADPADHERLHAAILEFGTHIDGATKRTKDAVAAINKLRYHVKRAAESPDETELAGLRGAADGLARAGLEPDDKRIRDLVGPLSPLAASSADIGEYLTRAVRLAGERSDGQAGEPREARAYSAGVAQVRAMLEGSRIVVLGGQDIAHQRERITEAFALGDLDWVSLREHASSEPLHSAIAAPGTRLVVALVKLAGHQHIEDARRWARQHERPFVMVPGGFSPEQVAAAVLEQVSGRLGGSAE